MLLARHLTSTFDHPFDRQRVLPQDVCARLVFPRRAAHGRRRRLPQRRRAAPRRARGLGYRAGGVEGRGGRGAGAGRAAELSRHVRHAALAAAGPAARPARAAGAQGRGGGLSGVEERRESGRATSATVPAIYSDGAIYNVDAHRKCCTLLAGRATTVPAESASTDGQSSATATVGPRVRGIRFD